MSTGEVNGLEPVYSLSATVQVTKVNEFINSLSIYNFRRKKIKTLAGPEDFLDCR